MPHKDTDYEKLLGALERVREGDRGRRERMRRLRRRGKMSKERGLLRDHHRIWERERERLESRRREVEGGMEEWRREMGRRRGGESGDGVWWAEFVSELVATEMEYRAEREEFLERVFRPVRKLRGRLRRTLGGGGRGGGEEQRGGRGGGGRGRRGGGGKGEKQRGGGGGGDGLRGRDAFLGELEEVRRELRRVEEELEEEEEECALVWGEVTGGLGGAGEEEEEEEEFCRLVSDCVLYNFITHGRSPYKHSV